ncbi:MAG TPA: hypothetical protein VJT09_04455 [Pyrinomonadaceae bacterium]|nr:hypothetical protein [Pyrinomonadaceae bacterium]
MKSFPLHLKLLLPALLLLFACAPRQAFAATPPPGEKLENDVATVPGADGKTEYIFTGLYSARRKP